MEYLLHWLTVLLAVPGVAWAIYLIPLSGKTRAWLWLSAALVFLATESVFETLAHGGILLLEWQNEIIGNMLHLLATASMLVGVIFIRKIFLEYRTSRHQVEQQLDELQRFQRVAIGRELRMKALLGDTPVAGTELQAQLHDVAQEGVASEADQRTALLFMLEDLARSQQLNEHAQQEWMATVDALRDPMFLHDAEFRVIRANRAYAGQAGKSFQEIIGHPYYEIFPKAAGPLPCCLRAMKKAAEEEEEEVAVGEVIYRSRAFSVKDGQGAYLYSVHTLEDITEHRQAEDKLTEQIDELRRWHEATLGREMRVLDLKREVNALLGSAGAPQRYPSAAAESQGE